MLEINRKYANAWRSVGKVNEIVDVPYCIRIIED